MWHKKLKSISDSCLTHLRKSPYPEDPERCVVSSVLETTFWDISRRSRGGTLVENE